MRLYDFTGNLGQLDYKKMFEIFEPEEGVEPGQLLQALNNQENRTPEEQR